MFEDIADQTVKDALAKADPIIQKIVLGLLSGELSDATAIIGTMQQMIRGEVDHFFEKIDRRVSVNIQLAKPKGETP